jgi:hypothetical protein
LIGVSDHLKRTVLSAISDDAVDAVQAHWLKQWRDAVPGSNPARASVLLAPIAAARQAVIYRKFLDNIEPSEQRYHRAIRRDG